MSIKERIKNEVETIVAKGYQIEQEVIVFIRKDYKNTLNDLQVDIKLERELALEYLEGVEDGLLAAGHESEKLIGRVADTLIEVSRELGTRSVEAAHKVALEARSVLNNALASTQDAMEVLAQKAGEQMQEAYVRLVEAEEAGKVRLAGVEAGIKAYLERQKTELADPVRQALNNSVDNVKELVQNLSQSTETKSRELIDSSLDKVADWLRDMADKIRP